jgi:hypothetical protein
LNPEHLHADDFSLTRGFRSYDAQPRLFVAVGSGTITDITRSTSHRSRNPFVSFQPLLRWTLTLPRMPGYVAD